MKEVYRFTKKEKEAISKAAASLSRLGQLMGENKFDIFDTNTGVTLDVTSIFVINEHLKTLADANAELLIERR